MRGIKLKALGFALIAVSFAMPTSIDAASCPSIARTLARGSSGADVKALQQFLVDDGYLLADDAKGTFDLDTEEAVKEWQVSKKIVSEGSPETTGWGMVGPKTRAAILASCAGEAHIASWVTNGPPRTTTPAVSTTNSAPKTQCKAAQRPTLPCANAWISVPSGGCIAAWYCIAFNTSKVSAPVSQANRAPSISGITGPTAVASGRVETWTVNGTDPDGGAITYSIDWGDSSSTVSPVDLISALGDSASTRSTFSHAYTRDGIFTLAATAKDSAGLSAIARLTVSVSSGSTSPTPIATSTTTTTSNTSTSTTTSTQVDTSLQCDLGGVKYPYGATRVVGSGSTAVTQMCSGGQWATLSAASQYSQQARYYCFSSASLSAAFYWSEFPCVNGQSLNQNNTCELVSGSYSCSYEPKNDQGCVKVVANGTWLCPFRSSYACSSGTATTTQQWPCAL